MKVIVVTGSVCSGKTTVAKMLAEKLGYIYIDVSRLISKYKLSSGYDRKRKCKVVDVGKLNGVLVNMINQYKENREVRGVIVDSHLSHYLPRRYVHLCIVVKCGLKELNKRLKRRGYWEGKVRENLQCEIFDVCLNESKELGHRIFVIDTTKGINIRSIMKEFKKIIGLGDNYGTKSSGRRTK